MSTHHVDSMKFAMQSIELRDQVASQTITQVKETVKRLNEQGEKFRKYYKCAEEAFKTYKRCLRETFPDPAYKPYISLMLISQEKFFLINVDDRVREAVASITSSKT